MTTCLLVYHIPRRACSETSSHSADSAPLQPRFGALRLLAFPKTKITFEREEISDHWQDSGKYDGASNGNWENCVRSQGAFFEVDWGIIVLCTMFLVSSSINVSIFHITWLDTFWTDLVYEGWDCIFPFPQIFSVLLESFWYNYNKNQKRKREKCFPGVTQEMECVRSQSVAVKKRRGMWVGKSWDWILMLSLPTHEPSRKGLHFSEYQSPSLWNGQVGTSMTWEDWTSLCSWKHLRQCLPHMRCPVQVSCNPFLTSISQMKTLRCKERKGPVQDHTAGLNSRSASNYFWSSEQEVTFPLWAELLHLWNE